MPPGLPYAHLNLRSNPFRELQLHEWAQLADVDTAPLLEHLTGQRAAVQFVGEKGYGKTTHLLALLAMNPQGGYVHIPEGERRPVPDGSPILIDEAQRLTWRQRYSLFRSIVPLALGTHRDFERNLRRCGRSVLTIEVQQAMSAERLHRLLNARIDAVRRTTGAIPRVSIATSRNLFEEFNANTRAILHELYGRFQNLTDVSEV